MGKKKKKGQQPDKTKLTLMERQKSIRSIDSIMHRERIQNLVMEFVRREEKLVEPGSLENVIHRFLAFLDGKNFDIVYCDDIANVPYRYLAFSSRLH